MVPSPVAAGGRLRRSLPWLVSAATVLLLIAGASRSRPDEPWLPNRILEPAPYDAAEALEYPPPYEPRWQGDLNPGRCGTCHARIFAEWNGSMMANAWRDPAWRAAFLLSARTLATDGGCDVPEPPDGTERARLNPFAEEGCSSRFDLGGGRDHRTAHSGSLLDGFCSRCHMPANYVDNVPVRGLQRDPTSGGDVADLSPGFDPTDGAGTEKAFATLAERYRNTEPGQRGIFCAVCHTMAETRDTPYHELPRMGVEYTPATGAGPRSSQVPYPRRHAPWPPADRAPNLGYGIGAGSFRLSPHAIVTGTLFGPLTAPDSERADQPDRYLSETFGTEVLFEAGRPVGHEAFHHVRFQRSEMCATCHDVTNPLTLRNAQGRWVGGFPIERTYSEWLGSRYADRPGNDAFDPRFKRDCQTCHMQQDRGRPGTAQTEYRGGRPLPPVTGRPAEDGPVRRPYFSHHFVGGNAYVPSLIGASVDPMGHVEPYPELSIYSFSSADPGSPYHQAVWTGIAGTSGRPTQHARLAWDRLRNAVDLHLEAPQQGQAGGRVPLHVEVVNSGCGHDFPSGFPEGRVAWVAVHARDLGTGEELEIYDAHWRRSSRGVGDLTSEEQPDPSFPALCGWTVPAGSPDPYAYQMKAVASQGDGCPTLDVVLATALNLAVDPGGRPLDTLDRVIDGSNPRGLPIYADLDGDGDLHDDAFLVDTRLRPLPHAGAAVGLDRYAVVVPPDASGPVLITAAVYYQSLEAVVAKKFLGNLADTDLDGVIEPCVLGGACDGREPRGEPPVVEGARPVPVRVVSRVVALDGKPDGTPPVVTSLGPAPDATGVPRDTVVRVTLSEPALGIDASRLHLFDADGRALAASVTQVDASTWALFPDRVFLARGGRYTARLDPVCDRYGNCLDRPVTWSFQVAGEE